MNKCRSCGRMLKADEQGKDFCKHCVDENGKLKTYDEVASNLASYLRETQGLDERASANAAKAIVSSQPVWEKKQGVYFEGDMKRKRNTIVTLVVVFALILTGFGISTLFWNAPEEEVKETKLFDDKDINHVVTHEIDGHKTYELDLPGYQYSPTVIVSTKEEPKRNYDTFVFASLDDLSANVDKQYDLYRYRFAKNGPQNYGTHLETGKLKSNFIQKNGVYVFLKTDDHEKSIRTVDELYKNKMYQYEADAPIARPYHPRHSIIEDHMESDAYFRVNGDYIIWCEFDVKSSSQSLYLRNFDTLRTIEISKTVAPFSKPLLLSNHVVWEDNRDVGSNTCALYCYDIDAKIEKKIHKDDNYLKLVESENDNIIAYFTYPHSDGIGTDFTLHVFDLKKSELVRSFNDNFSSSNYVWHDDHNDAVERNFPDVCISNDSENPILAWNIRPKYEGDFPPGTKWFENSEESKIIDDKDGIVIFKVGKNVEPYVIESDIRNPVAITGEFMLLSDSWSFYVARIPDSGNQLKLVKLHTEIFFILDKTDNFKIDKDFVFWKTLKYKKVVNESNEGYDVHIDGFDEIPSGKYIITGSNICWARLSEIFPEDELVGAMGE